MNYAIILSGGIGTRMRTDGFPKQYLQVEGKTILQYTLETLAECSIIDVIVIVMAEEWKKKIGKYFLPYQVRQDKNQFFMDCKHALQIRR